MLLNDNEHRQLIEVLIETITERSKQMKPIEFLADIVKKLRNGVATIPESVFVNVNGSVEQLEQGLLIRAQGPLGNVWELIQPTTDQLPPHLIYEYLLAFYNSDLNEQERIINEGNAYWLDIGDTPKIEPTGTSYSKEKFVSSDQEPPIFAPTGKQESE